MKATAKSDFHAITVSFSGLKEGRNYRKLRGKRSTYCLDYTNENSHVCGCGFPVSRATWEVPSGFIVHDVREIGHPDDIGSDYGHGYLQIDIAGVS